MPVVELESPSTRKIFEQLAALPPSRALQLPNATPALISKLRSIAFRHNLILGVSPSPAGPLLTLKPKSGAIPHPKCSPLATVTPEEECEQFVAQAAAHCRNLRIQLPTWSQIFAIVQQLGYTRSRARLSDTHVTFR